MLSHELLKDILASFHQLNDGADEQTPLTIPVMTSATTMKTVKMTYGELKQMIEDSHV